MASSEVRIAVTTLSDVGRVRIRTSQALRGRYSFGRHGGTTEASASGLTETQLMKKGQRSSTAAMAHYLHDDDEAKQDAQMKRLKRRARQAKQAKGK